MSFSRTLKERTNSVWEDCYQHPFLQELGKGKLEKETFMFYLKQDYKYLLEYAKIFALGALKAVDEPMVKSFTFSQQAVLDEMNIHRRYMEDNGISLAEADATVSSLFNKAYTSNMMTVGYTEGILELMAALLPCGWSYYDFACRLKKDYPEYLADNYYKSWIETYASEEFYQSFSWFFPRMDQLAASRSEEELQKIVHIFQTSIEFEYLFWDMAYNKQLSY